MPPISIARSTGSQATGISASMHAILTATISISDVLPSGPPIVVTTAGTDVEASPGITDVTSQSGDSMTTAPA